MNKSFYHLLSFYSILFLSKLIHIHKYRNLKNLENWKKEEDFNYKPYKMDKSLNKYRILRKMKKELKKEKKF